MPRHTLAVLALLLCALAWVQLRPAGGTPCPASDGTEPKSGPTTALDSKYEDEPGRVGRVCSLTPAGLLPTNAIIDRGEVKGGPPLKQAFELVNRTANRVTLTAVESGCGCVRSALSAKELGPGERCELKVEVNTLTQPDGPNTWRFVVKYKADADGQVEVRLAATLRREVTVTPPMMAVSTDGGEVTHDIVVHDTRATPFRVTAAVPTADFLTAKLIPGDGGKTTVRVTVPATAPDGTHDAAVVLTTSDPAYPELRVPVKITKRAKAGVRAFPATVELSGPDAVAVVQLRRADGGGVEIEKATAAGRGVLVRWSQTAGPVGTVRVWLGADAPKSGKGEVVVTFKQPGGTATVPVSWGD